MPQLLTADNLSLGADTKGNPIKSKITRASHSEASWEAVSDDLATMSLICSDDVLSEARTQRFQTGHERRDEYFVVSSFKGSSTLVKLPITYDEAISFARGAVAGDPYQRLLPRPISLYIEFGGKRVPLDDLDWSVVRHGSIVLATSEVLHASMISSPTTSWVSLSGRYEAGYNEVYTHYCCRKKLGETVGDFKNRIAVRLGVKSEEYELRTLDGVKVLHDDEPMAVQVEMRPR